MHPKFRCRKLHLLNSNIDDRSLPRFVSCLDSLNALGLKQYSPSVPLRRRYDSMMAKNLARIHRPTDAFTIPTFLAPSLLSIRHLGVQSSQFSTTSPKGKITRDRNRERGVSALRRTGTKYVLPTSKEPLPEPVLDPAKRSKVVGNEKHGLWDFFDKDRKAFVEPENEGAHGIKYTPGSTRHPD